MEIKKKIWPGYLEQILAGEKNFEIRLADFEVNPGDILILEEYDPKTEKYTGRTIKKRVSFINKLPLEFYSPEEIKKHGLLYIGIE
jgi:hypothetical protein